MATPKLDVAADGRPRHYSVGALIKNGDSYLLFDRVKKPFGYAGPAGHVDEGEDPDTAVVREVEEETGLKVVSFSLLFEEELPWDTCSRGIPVHHWRLYHCEVEGALNPEAEEARKMGWYNPRINWPTSFDPAWAHWFKKLGIG